MEQILVAVDSWKRAGAAFSRAMRIAAEHCAALQLVHVHAGSASGETLHLLHDELRRQAVEKLGEDCERVRLTVEVREGDPAEAIFVSAEDLDPDLIVLGDHGRLRMRDRVFGTTATQVVRESEWPVLVARKEPVAGYSSVMAAVDDIGSAGQVLNAACALGPVASLTVVHVARDQDEGEAGGQELLAEPRTMYRRSLEEYLAGLVERHPGMKTQVEIAEGQSSAMVYLAQRWAELDPDLLVLGTRGRSPLVRLLSGSHAETAMLECRSDVLVVPTQSTVL